MSGRQIFGIRNSAAKRFVELGLKSALRSDGLTLGPAEDTSRAWVAAAPAPA